MIDESAPTCVQTGELPRQGFWIWYGHWWPLLLVLAGVALVAEWAFDQHRLSDPTRPQYRRSVGSGVVFLLLLFAAAGIFSSHIYPFQNNWIVNSFHFGPDSLDQIFGDKHESDQAVDFAFPAGASLNLSNPAGDVTVTGASDDNRIHIAVHKQIYTRTDSEANTKADQFAPQVSSTSSSVSVSMPSLDGARANLIVTIPPAAALTLTANHGDIHISGLQAPVTVTANHGDIELSAITGQVTARINSGGASFSAHSIGAGVSIEGHADDLTLSGIAGPVDIHGEFFGTTHIEHVPASVHFHTSRTDFQLARLDGEIEISPNSALSADQALGPVVLTTHGRNITLDRIAGDISVTNRDGSIDLTAAPTLGNVTLEDRNGSIKAIVPDHTGFSVEADTSSGHIDSDLALSSTQTNNNRTSGREGHDTLNGTVGSGGPLIHITTTNGDISLQKETIQPIPLTPPAPPKLTLAPPAPPKLTIAPPARPRPPAKP